MTTVTDTSQPCATRDDVNLIESAHDMLEAAMSGNAEPHDLWRLTREIDAMLHRWRMEQRETRS